MSYNFWVPVQSAVILVLGNVNWERYTTPIVLHLRESRTVSVEFAHHRLPASTEFDMKIWVVPYPGIVSFSMSWII